MNSTVEAAFQIDQLQLTRTGLVLDFFHFRTEGESLPNIGIIRDLLYHVHIAGEGRSFPTELDSRLKEEMEYLLETGFKGSISIETDHGFVGDKAFQSLNFLRTVCCPIS